jgi:hypothetical protein
MLRGLFTRRIDGVAFFAKWDGFRWHPKSNTRNEPWKIFDADWPDGLTEEMLPVPRFSAGMRIRFDWGDKYLEGEVLEVKTYFHSLADPSVVYEVREIGHHRTLYDRGDADITYIRIRP